MENYSSWFFTLIPFFLRKIMIWAKWPTNNFFYIGLGQIEWLMIAFWILGIGYYCGKSRDEKDRKKTEQELSKLKDECLNEIRNCYSKFENEYVPLKEKIAVQKFELEKEQWRVKVLREALDEEQTKKKRTPEQANKEAIHSVGGN